MLAQRISLAYREGFQAARREPLITLGSAPLDVPEFRAVVLGQLGEPKLMAAIENDIAGPMSHARALDADTKGPLRDIHRRVGAVILFESSGGQVQKIAYLPELRFALGEPEVDTTSVDNAAAALESKSFFIRRVGPGGYQISHKFTLRKVVNDRRAALDDEAEVRPRLRLVVMPPEVEWSDSVRAEIAKWIRTRGEQSRQHPGALIFCVKKPGRSLREAVETWLAWERVDADMRSGQLGEDFDHRELAGVRAKVGEALADGVKVIDLGAGHASSGETLCARILRALKAEGLLGESVGAGYIERHWPPALEASGAWPLASLRQAFLDGSLIRLLDPEWVLKAKIPEFVAKGDLGLASGAKPDGSYQRVWYAEPVPQDEIVFEHDVYLLKKDRAKALKAVPVIVKPVEPVDPTERDQATPSPVRRDTTVVAARRVQLSISGTVPPEVWNRLGTRLIPRLRPLKALRIDVKFMCEVEAEGHATATSDIRTAIEDLGLSESLHIAESPVSDSERDASGRSASGERQARKSHTNCA